MVTDHTKADDNLNTAASKDNISLPTQLNAKDLVIGQTYHRLSLSQNSPGRHFLSHIQR